MSQEGVRRLVSEFGTQTKLGEISGVHQQEVGRWVRDGFVPTKHAVRVALVSSTPIVEYVHPDVVELIRLAIHSEQQ